MEARLTRWGRVASATVLGITVLNWVGWAAGVEALTRVRAAWPHMMPWTALLLAALALSIWLQASPPSPRQRRAAGVLAIAVAAIAAAMLVEYLLGVSIGLDSIWFADSLGAVAGATWPGRPSPQTATALLLLAIAVGWTRRDHAHSELPSVVALTGSAVIPLMSAAAYLFGATPLVNITPSTGQAILTVVGLLLLTSAAIAVRPDRVPLRWLLARSDWLSLVRLIAVLAGFPVVVAACRLILRVAGVSGQVVWAVAITLGTVTVGALTFYLSQREQRLLIAKEELGQQRADAEKRYRILADNAVDVIIQLRGRTVVWASPSVEAAFGGSQQRWAGSDFSARVHPDDMDGVFGAYRRIEVGGESVLVRFRVCTEFGVYHWVDGHGKRYVGEGGVVDGVIAALRIVDDQVEVERRLDRLARFDTLTGLVNRAEAMGRLTAALADDQSGGPRVGILFCDVDGFKRINDTWGHGAGDTVLAVLAERIVDCVGPQDTVGRTGGDELIVLLPGIDTVENASVVAEAIRRRAAEPIQTSGQTILVTLSIGAAVAVPGESITSITARADAAMYDAKLAHKHHDVGSRAFD